MIFQTPFLGPAVYIDLISLNGTAITPNKGTGSPCDEAGAPWCGNPISIGSGNKYEHLEDYRTEGSNPLAFERYYNSLGNAGSLATTLGAKWRSNYDRYLRIVSANTVTAERADGQEISFSLNGGVWTSDSDVDVSLKQNEVLWMLTDKDDTVESYTSISATQAQLQSIKARNGYKQTLHHNTDQTLASVVDSYGRSLIFGYQSGLLNTVTTPENALTFGYTATGSQNLLTSVSYSTSPVTTVTYVYDSPSLPTFLTGIKDENGNRFATWTYDNQGRALTSQHGSGAELTTVTYNDTDNSRTVTNALGVTDTYSFSLMQGVPKVTQISRAASATTAAATQYFTYDTNGYPSGKIDWNGNTTIYTNNVHGQSTAIVEGYASPVARSTTITYDPTWVHLPSTIVTPGLTTAFQYDSSGNVHTKTFTDTTSTNGTVRTWTYGWSNYLLGSITGPRTDLSAVTQLGYDSTGALVSVTNAVGKQTNIKTHTAGGRPLTIDDPNGVTTQLAYDGRQRPTSSTLTTAAGPLTTSSVFDPAGNLTATTQPDGSTLKNTYDPAHRLTQVTDSFGNYIKYTLDALDDRTQTQVCKSNGTMTWQQTGTFDALGRLHISTAGAGQTTTQNFDANGNVVSVVDGRNNQTSNTYDALNRLGISTDANGGVTKPVFDAHDRIVSVTDANGNTTSYTRNGFGDVIQRISPDSGTAVFHVDGDGNVTSKTDALGIVTNQTFDALDRPLARTYPASTAENVSFTYDQATAGFSFGVGSLTTVMDQTGTVTRQHDERGNLISEKRINGASTLTTSYSYDKAARIGAMTYPDGTLVTYQHDAAGYLSNVTAKLSGSSITTQIATFTHQPFGPMGSVTYGNGITEAWTFDQSYRPGTITDVLSDTSLQNLTYNYDYSDNVASITDTVNPANSQTFYYDPLNRLTNAASGSGGYGSFAWLYDKVGNRQSEVHGPSTTTYGYAPGSNRLATITSIMPVAALAPLSSPSMEEPDQVASVSARISSSENPTLSPAWVVEQPPLKTASATKILRPYIDSVAFTDPAPRLISAAYIAATRGEEAQSPSVPVPHYNPIAPPIHIPIGPPVISPPPPGPVPIMVLPPPTFSPVAGTYIGSEKVSLTDDSATANIFYTLDGSTPTGSSTRYTSPILVSRTETIKAVAVSSSSTSGIAAASYTIDTQTVTTVQTNANGNITSIPPANSTASASFSYNNANRLQSVTGSPLAAVFIYDYAGQRFSKTNPGTPPTIYSYAQGATLIADNNGGTVTDYIYADGRPIAQLQPSSTPAANQVSYVLADRLGTPQRLVNSGGTTVWSTTYQPFGTTGTINATFNQNLRFPGQFADAETGFSYNQNRDYMPNVGRYLQSDPVGLVAGSDTYSYLENNPLAGSDPLGLQSAIVQGPDCQNLDDGFCEAINQLTNRANALPAKLKQKSREAICLSQAVLATSALTGGFGAMSGLTEGNNWEAAAKAAEAAASLRELHKSKEELPPYLGDGAPVSSAPSTSP